MFRALARLLRAERDVKAAKKGPTSYGKRVARRKTTRRVGRELNKLLKF